MKAKQFDYRLIVINLAFLLGSILFALVFTRFYVTSEHAFYWSDYATYQNLTHWMWSTSQVSIQAALTSLTASIGNDYNLIFTIPIAPFYIFWGESRVVFESALALVYLLPFVFVLGAIATRILPYQTLPVFWSTVFVALLLPVLWVPLLRGYPDVGGAFLMGLAVWLYLRDLSMQRRWTALLIGVLLALAILFRRHFAFEAISFFAALGLFVGGEWALKFFRKTHLEWNVLWSNLFYVALVGLAFGGTLLLLGRPLVENILGNNYIKLYASFSNPWYVTLEVFSRRYGLLTGVLALLGLALGVYLRTVRRSEFSFFILFGSLSAVIWFALVGQVGVHYTLHTTPLIVIGIVTLGWTGWSKLPEWRGYAFVGVGTVLLVGLFGLGLLPLKLNVNKYLIAFLPQAAPPLRDGNYEEHSKLVRFLRSQVGNSEPIYIPETFPLLDADLIRNAERTLYGWRDSKLNLQSVPLFDSRDAYPLELLLQAQYVVFSGPKPEPAGKPATQRVNRVVFALFDAGVGLAKDFERVPESLQLNKGREIQIYKRVRQTDLPTTIESLQFIEQYVKARPGGQLDWIPLDPAKEGSVSRTRDGYAFAVENQALQNGGTADFLFIGEIPGLANLQGKLEPSAADCPTFRLELVPLNQAGQALEPSGAMSLPSGQFSLPVSGQAGNYLLLRVKPESESLSKKCSVTLDAMTFASQ